PCANGDAVLLLFERTVDQGATGSTGVTGATGATGPTGPSKLAVETTTQSVGNVTSEVTVFSKTVPANTLGTDGMLRWTFTGRIAKNATATPTLKVKFGGTTLWAITTVIPTSAASGFSEIKWDFWLA